jgi:hypothetical protein
MMTSEDGVAQVIEAPLAGRAAVALALWLPIVVTVSRYLVTAAPRAPHTRGPTQTPDCVKALGVINQELEVDQGIHRGRLLPADNGEHPRSQDQSSGTSIITTDRRQDPPTTLKPDMSQFGICHLTCLDTLCGALSGTRDS